MAVIFTHKIKKHNYELRAVYTGTYYDIEILKMPSYGKRFQNLEITHRVPINVDNQKWRICFGIPEVIDTLDKAHKWGKIWCENTSKYILTGKHFPNEGKKH